jgi:hypothetical protein
MRVLLIVTSLAFVVGCGKPDEVVQGRVTRVEMKNGKSFEACSFVVEGHRFLSIDDSVMHHPGCQCFTEESLLQ